VVVDNMTIAGTVINNILTSIPGKFDPGGNKQRFVLGQLF